MLHWQARTSSYYTSTNPTRPLTVPPTITYTHFTLPLSKTIIPTHNAYLDILKIVSLNNYQIGFCFIKTWINVNSLSIKPNIMGKVHDLLEGI